MNPNITNKTQILTDEDSLIIRNAILDQIDHLKNTGGIRNAIASPIYELLNEHDMRSIIMDGLERALCSGPEMYDAIRDGIERALSTGPEVCNSIERGASEGMYLAASEALENQD